VKTLLSLTLVVFVSLALADDKADPKKSDKERLQGTWVVAALETDCKEVKGETFEAFKKGKVTFKGDSFTHSMAPDSVVKFTLDPDKKPLALDLEVTDPAKAVFRYLYEFVDDDTIRLCSSGKDGAARPKEFTSKDGQVIVTYKREGKRPKQ
jgi:uncharacterized protein (TIGR03067 family)